MFVFKPLNGGNVEDLEDAVDALESFKVFKGEMGFDLLLNKQNAKKLVTDGFRAKKLYPKIVFGKKNYPREDK